MCSKDPFNKIALTARSRLFDYRLHSKNKVLARQILCCVGGKSHLNGKFISSAVL